MRERGGIRIPGVSALLTVFSVLCLVVLALLCLSTARARLHQAELAARGAEEYYRAEMDAQELFARLRAGEIPEGVTREGDIWRYTCPVSRHQQLEVALENREGRWQVLTWRTRALAPEEEQTLPVWQGPDQTEEVEEAYD